MSEGKATMARSKMFERMRDLEREVSALRRALHEESVTGRRMPEQDFDALCFVVADDLYAVPIDAVREIVRYVELTRVADVPDSVAGALNLRGEVLPVLDARLRFGHAYREPNDRTAIALFARGKRSVGLIVDGVRDVAHVKREALSSPSGALAHARAICAIATADQRILQVVDMDALFDSEQWEALDEAFDSIQPENTHP